MNSIDKLAISFISNGLKYSVSKAEEVYKKIKPKINLQKITIRDLLSKAKDAA